MAACIPPQVANHDRQNCSEKKRPGGMPGRRGTPVRSEAAIYQPPAQSEWGRDQAPHVAAAKSAGIIGRTANDYAGPKCMMMMVVVAPTVGGRGGRRHRGRSQRGRGRSNEQEFAKHNRLLKIPARKAPSVKSSRLTWRACQMSDCSQCMGVKLNRYVTQVSQRIHLDEIGVICASGSAREAGAPGERPAKSAGRARHRAACRDGMAPI